MEVKENKIWEVELHNNVSNSQIKYKGKIVSNVTRIEIWADAENQCDSLVKGTLSIVAPKATFELQEGQMTLLNKEQIVEEINRLLEMRLISKEDLTFERD